MKKYQILLLLSLIAFCGNAQTQHITLSTYSGQNEIKAGASITLTDGFYVPAGSTLRIFTSPTFLVTVPFVGVPSNNQNFISTLTFKKPVESENISGLNVSDVNQDIQYFDGLNRLVQRVQTQASPSFADIVQPIAYDVSGLETIKYLPYTVAGSNGSYRSNAFAEQSNFYNSPPNGVKNIPSPFSVTVFESSPLNRVIEQGAPGNPWQPVANSNIGHTAKTEYGVNANGEVKQWNINTTDNGAIATIYPSGKLYKTITRDENWQPGDMKAGTTEEFKDIEGHTVLKRLWETDDKSLNTYYIYDDFDNLRYVLPPAVNENGQSIIDSFDETQQLFNEFIYAYHYDGRRRQIERKLPGKGWDFMVYNKLDQLVLSQDANQRDKSPQEWSFSKYDAMGRIIITGIYTYNNSLADISLVPDRSKKNWLQNYSDSQTILWESRDNNNLVMGYSSNAMPQADFIANTINYYDDYDFAANTFGLPTGDQAPKERTKSLITGTKVKNLGNGHMLLSVNYYDLEGRVVQSKSENHMNGIDVVDKTWNFDGSLESNSRRNTVNGITTIIAERYEYDHMGRKIATFENINNKEEIVLSHLLYNEIEQVKQKSLHNDMQTIVCNYNERGWLKNSISNLFSLKLDYEDGIGQGYNGNITKQYWDLANKVDPIKNIFSYGYDKLGRLKTATTTAGILMKEVLTYDVMGNIASLNRDDAGAKIYNYYNFANRLQNINGLTTVDYQYDLNGNAIIDGVNGINLTYNYLNRVVKATRSTGVPVNLSYTYDAEGNKLIKNSNGSVRNYIKGIEYKTDGTIDIIHTEEGIARNNGDSYNYEYNLNDHLGNVRTTFYKNPNTNQIEVLQNDDYYAFGLRKEPVIKAGINKYLYNGKELQEELGQYDYGARLYDPVVGRWNVIDPLAESSSPLTPYHYGLNNPILMIDPDGKFAYPIITVTNEKIGAVQQTVAGYSSGTNGKAAVTTVNVYRAVVTDTEDANFRMEFGVTRAGYVVTEGSAKKAYGENGNWNGARTATNMGFQPATGSSNIYQAQKTDSEVPKGSGLPALMLTQNGSTKLPSADRSAAVQAGVPDASKKGANGIEFHVGGYYKYQGKTTLSMAYGCFGIVNKDNSPSNPSNVTVKNVLGTIIDQSNKSQTNPGRIDVVVEPNSSDPKNKTVKP
ncbi:DUF6443 domain-containing protein [Pedobacter sp. BG31]|uniref:DUF6443 domain-containing protein n=1 Tax=Pedobacter sp. BG31 TaxID=3349697 RepID=UPI0035F4F251